MARSRIGKEPIQIPAGVEVGISDKNVVTVKGPKGTLTQTMDPAIKVTKEDGVLTFSRPTDLKHHRSMHGLYRALVANMVETGRTPLLTPGELADLGFTLIVSPLSALFSMVKAVQDSLTLLRSEGSLRGHLDRLVAFDEFTALVDLDGHVATEARYRD